MFWGIEDIPLVRKVYRGKRDASGSRHNEVYYVSHDQQAQSYENILLKKKINAKEFKDIIEKIEVYETGLLCIFNNGLEMSVQF